MPFILSIATAPSERKCTVSFLVPLTLCYFQPSATTPRTQQFILWLMSGPDLFVHFNVTLLIIFQRVVIQKLFLSVLSTLPKKVNNQQFYNWKGSSLIWYPSHKAPLCRYGILKLFVILCFVDECEYPVEKCQQK